MSGRSAFVTVSMFAVIVGASFSGGSMASNQRDQPAINSIGSSAPATQAASPTPSPTPLPVSNGALPVVSPDGSLIVFVSNRSGADDVFVIYSDGTGELQLTHTTEGEGNAQWSSNGKQIVFSRFANGTSHIYAIGPDGKNEHEIGSVP